MDLYKNLTFEQAYQELEKIVEEIENDKIWLDQITEKIAYAKKLLKFCENKLKKVEKEISSIE